MKEAFEKIVTWLRTVAALPVVAPILSILHSRTVIFGALGTFVYGILPTVPWLAADPARLKTVGDIIIVLTLLVSGRYTVEGLVIAYKQIPTGTLDELIRGLIAAFLQELLNPTTPEQEENSEKLAMVVRNATIRRTTAAYIANTNNPSAGG